MLASAVFTSQSYPSKRLNPQLTRETSNTVHDTDFIHLNFYLSKLLLVKHNFKINIQYQTLGKKVVALYKLKQIWLQSYKKNHLRLHDCWLFLNFIK